MKVKTIITVVVILSFNILSAQWQEEWQSGNSSSLNISGWIDLTDNDQEDYNFYILDEQSFKIMSGYYSNSVQYSYSFTPEEIAAGYQVYSTGFDLNHDGINEFYILAYHDSDTNPRQSFKIFDITNNNIIFERNSSSEYYTYPVIWDTDNDNILECSFAVYDYPNFSGYQYIIMNTEVVTSLNKSSSVPKGFKVKQNYPNPFNPSTTFEYSIDQADNVVVQVIDIKGEVINTLVDDYKSSGKYDIRWNGTNSTGSRVSSGPYFYRVVSGGKSITRKMVLIK